MLFLVFPMLHGFFELLFLTFFFSNISDSEPSYWYWEVIVIFKKMLLTGAMTIVKPGSSAQLSIALIIVLFNMLLELKLAPYADEADDWLAFLTNIQMLLTIQGGLLLMTDDSSAPTYDKRFMGITLVVVNSFGFVAFFCGLLVLHPSIRTRITDAKKKRSGSKVVPQSGVEKKNNNTSISTTNDSDVKNWGKEL